MKKLLLLLTLAACGAPEKKKPTAPKIPESEITIPVEPEPEPAIPVVDEPRQRAFNVDPPPLPPGAETPPAPTVTIGVCWEPTPESATQTITYLARATSMPNRVGLVKENITKATITWFDGLVPNKAYFFHVIARNDQALESEPSAEIGYMAPKMTMRRGVVSYERTNPSSPNVSHKLFFKRDLNQEGWTEVLSVGRVLSVIDGVETIAHDVPADEPMMFFNLVMEIRSEGCAAK